MIRNLQKSKLTYTNYYEQALHIDAPTGAGNKYQGIMPPGPADFDDEYTVDDKSYGSVQINIKLIDYMLVN